MDSLNKKWPADYSYEIDRVDENHWNNLLKLFDDANLHQTWSAAAVSRGHSNLSHLVFRKGQEIIGICQVTFKRLPMLNLGVADVYNGPLWRKHACRNAEYFEYMITVLKKEYAENRGLLLRVWPNEFRDTQSECMKILQDNGFKHNPSAAVQRTLLLDLSLSLDQLRKNLNKTWKLHLNRAEKNSLRIVEGTSDYLYAIFLVQLKEMLARKQFVQNVDYEMFRIIQQRLPEDLKMKIMVAESEGVPVSTIICSAFGDTGIYLLGATANEGLKANASNLLHWKMLQWLKEGGYKWYDLGGIDPEQNPGTYQFKRGLGGSIAIDVTKLGQYDLCEKWGAKLFAAFMHVMIPLRERIRHLRIAKGHSMREQ